MCATNASISVHPLSAVLCCAAPLLLCACAGVSLGVSGSSSSSSSSQDACLCGKAMAQVQQLLDGMFRDGLTALSALAALAALGELWSRHWEMQPYKGLLTCGSLLWAGSLSAAQLTAAAMFLTCSSCHRT